jgi:hypothetical protein
VIFDISQPYRSPRPVIEIAVLLLQGGGTSKIKKKDKRKMDGGGKQDV